MALNHSGYHGAGFTDRSRIEHKTAEDLLAAASRYSPVGSWWLLELSALVISLGSLIALFAILLTSTGVLRLFGPFISLLNMRLFRSLGDWTQLH